jgi:hypothetical protein
MWMRNAKFLQGGLQQYRLNLSHDLGSPSGTFPALPGIVPPRTPVRQVVAVPTPEGPLPSREIKPPHAPPAAAQEPEALAAKGRPDSGEGNRLLIDKDVNPDALAANVDRQAAGAAVCETALNLAKRKPAGIRPCKRAGADCEISEHSSAMEGRHA